MRQKRMRMELGGFALVAILICGMIAVFLLGKDNSMPVGPLASRDCKRWAAQANIPQAGYYKDGSRLMQSLPDSTLTVTLESPQSPVAREFSYLKLHSDYTLAISSKSFGKLPPATTSPNEGEWTVHYDEPSKPILTAKIQDLGAATCKTDGCFFSLKDNIQALPLDGQATAIAALKAQGYFGEKLQHIKDACEGIREPGFRADFAAQVVQLQSACGLSNASAVAKVTAADIACQALESSAFPAAQKY